MFHIFQSVLQLLIQSRCFQPICAVDKNNNRAEQSWRRCCSSPPRASEIKLRRETRKEFFMTRFFFSLLQTRIRFWAMIQSFSAQNFREIPTDTFFAFTEKKSLTEWIPHLVACRVSLPLQESGRHWISYRSRRTNGEEKSMPEYGNSSISQKTELMLAKSHLIKIDIAAAANSYLILWSFDRTE